nr:AzlD domain-containing protein [Burkholderia vietnamiensis]
MAAHPYRNRAREGDRVSATEIWLVIVGMTIVTAVTRALFLIGGERTVLPERAQRALRYAPAAALVAVVLPDVLETPAGLSFALTNHPFYAALAGLGWFLWRRSMLGTIISGMLVFTVLRILF